MTSPTGYRSVAGLQVPLALVPRLITAIRARYPEATKDIVDHDAAVRAALLSWARETLVEYETAAVKAAMPMQIAQLTAAVEKKAADARTAAQVDGAQIVESPTLTPEELEAHSWART